ncbi:cupin domain-containing protein [Arsenicibacter rosenii]|uniref:Cupin type-2 domain-containing protein n=1 Tax=Arsenicibacter rosenii TaxID=1750698 RepID=A0A1S2VI88_9BACT|nr:cupin domain-containing protein [Arsenicibacter rosenii]OIN58120.1 hypothetical protein BLX24_16485 [Arsenicibacter rosenii]
MKAQLSGSRTIHHPFINDHVTFVRTAQESGYSHTWVEVILAPGRGVSLHYHKEHDETFMCLEGQLRLQIGSKELNLKPGQYASAVAGTPHRFVNATSAPCRFKCVISPGNPAFEQTLQIRYGLAHDGKCSPKTGSPSSWLMHAYTYALADTKLAGPLSILNPMIQWLYNRAVSTGMAARLQEEYVKIQ